VARRWRASMPVAISRSRQLYQQHQLAAPGGAAFIGIWRQHRFCQTGMAGAVGGIGARHRWRIAAGGSALSKNAAKAPSARISIIAKLLGDIIAIWQRIAHRAAA